MSKCVFGFDFGTMSCRGVALSLDDGKLLASAEKEYSNGVISGNLPNSDVVLPPEWFLQSPEDWIESMEFVSKKMLSDGGISPDDVVGLGTDFTNCTLLPVLSDGTPLCMIDKYKHCPNAWPKLWKHHGAQKYAEEIEDYAKKHTDWLKIYFGGSVSSEWVFPKVMQVLREDPEIYQAADYFIEAVDWIVQWMTGEVTRNYGILGVNAFWIKGRGFPDNDFLGALAPELKNIGEMKLSGHLLKPGDAAGRLTKKAADRLGLTERTVIAAGHGDSAVVASGIGVTQSGSMILVMGTSTCHQMLYKDLQPIDGVCSIAADGMIPGLYSYESGQPATGDVFSWFAHNCVPAEYKAEATLRGVNVLESLGAKAAALRPAECGILALDWLNGNRSILSNYNLSGAMIGLTISTKPEEIYRSLVEANLFGSRMILENHERGGVKIDRVHAVGGIPAKSPWIMQTCADILGREISVPCIDNISARGAAVCGAVAVGGTEGCADFYEAAERLVPKTERIYTPVPDNVIVYDELYRFYTELHDMFGRNSKMMKILKDLRLRSLSCK